MRPCFQLYCLSPQAGKRRIRFRKRYPSTRRQARSVWGDLVGDNPTGRGKKGVKRSLLAEALGGPLTVVIGGANTHEAQLLRATLAAVVVERPQPTAEEPQHLGLDKAYGNPTGHQAAAQHGYVPHIRRVGEGSSPPTTGGSIPPVAGSWNARWLG